MNFPSTDQLGVLIPVVALMIPIVRTLSSHQLKMAELLHNGQSQQTGRLEAQISALHAEVASLREVVNSQTIALDGLMRPPVDSVRIEDRLIDRP